MGDWDGTFDIYPRPRLVSIVTEVQANEKAATVELYDFYGCEL